MRCRTHTRGLTCVAQSTLLRILKRWKEMLSRVVEAVSYSSLPSPDIGRLSSLSWTAFQRAALTWSVRPPASLAEYNAYVRLSHPTRYRCNHLSNWMLSVKMIILTQYSLLLIASYLSCLHVSDDLSWVLHVLLFYWRSRRGRMQNKPCYCCSLFNFREDLRLFLYHFLVF